MSMADGYVRVTGQVLDRTVEVVQVFNGAGGEHIFAGS